LGSANTCVVIVGHSHLPYLEDANRRLPLNPGSATDRRSQPHCTVAPLTIRGGVPQAEIIPLS
jgi:uncharacterized protein